MRSDPKRKWMNFYLKRTFCKTIAGTIILLFSIVAILVGCTQLSNQDRSFDADRAMKDVENQVSFGPRTPGSDAHKNTRDYITNELEKVGWEVETQEFTMLGHIGYNLVATRSNQSPPILLAAHYDSRILADHDPDPAARALGVPGANDGASGVAVLLEIGRTLPLANNSVGLVFFDLEDNGRIDTWDWILGSKAFVDKIKYEPKAVVVVDMVGKVHPTFTFEENSDDKLNQQIWNIAESIGYGSEFIQEPGLTILDDHLPFLLKNIPAVDIIDLDYAYWHTSKDTIDKVSPKSLEAVGVTLLKWIETYGTCIEKENCN